MKVKNRTKQFSHNTLLRGVDKDGNEWLDQDLYIDLLADKLATNLFEEQMITVREAYSLEKSFKRFLHDQLNNKLI